MCIDWWIFAMPYLFSCIVSSYLTLAHNFIYIFMLTTSPCWWIFLNVFINKLLLATTTGKQCSTILLLTWTDVAYLTLFFIIKIMGPPPCPRGPVQLTGPRGIFFTFDCIFHQYCQNILEIYASYEILHQNDFAQFFAIFRSSRTSIGTTCSANAPLRNSVT